MPSINVRTLGLLALTTALTVLSFVPAQADDAKKDTPKEPAVVPAAAPDAKSGNSDIDDLNSLTLALWAASQDQAGDGSLSWLPTVTHRSVFVVGRSASGTAKKETDAAFPILTKGRDKEYGAIFTGAGGEKLPLKATAAIWVKSGVKVRPTLMKQFDSNFGVKTFITPSESPADKVNAWISSVTDGKVVAGVTADTFKGNPPVVMTTAATIKGTWASTFSAKKTAEREFTLSDGKSKVKVPFMSQRGEFVTFDVTDGTALALPLDGGAVAIYVLPKDGKTVDDVVKALTATVVRDAADKASSGAKKTTDVIVPKFKHESLLDLKKTAIALNVKKAFDSSASSADLSFEELTPSDIYLASWTQKTTHEWNENGFEGTAVEVLVAMARGIDPPADVTFRADRPFLFMVVEKGLIVDLARVNNPTK